MDEKEIAKLVALRNRIREADKRYREKHVEDIKIKRKQFYEANKETIKEKNREYQKLYRARLSGRELGGVTNSIEN
jgi:hypothetical protein